jgi:hypothetical protein
VGGDAAACRAAARETARWLGQAFALRVTRSGLVLVDGAPGGNAVELRIDLGDEDRASLRARVWSAL